MIIMTVIFFILIIFDCYSFSFNVQDDNEHDSTCKLYVRWLLWQWW